MHRNTKSDCCFYPARELRSLAGFTLVELIIVVAIILILSVIALVKYTNVIEKTHSAEAYAVLSDIAAAENAYNGEYSAFTTTWASLDRYSSAPLSANFTYTLEATYGKAASKIGGSDYCLYFNGTKGCP